MQISIDKMELPELDIVRATPIKINLGIINRNYILFPFIKKNLNMIFQPLTVEKYFIFESKYLKLLTTYFIYLSNINFLEYKDFADEKMVESALKELNKKMQNKLFMNDFIGILNKYFTANFNILKIMEYITPIQLSYLFLFIHKTVETVKKKFLLNLTKISKEVSALFSTSSQGSSEKVEPRY